MTGRLAREARLVSKPRAASALGVPNLALRWFGIALLVRLLIGTAADLYSHLQGFEGFFPLASGADDRFYWYAVQEYFNGNFVYVSNAYPWVLIGLFSITGPNLLFGKLLNILAGALTVSLGVLLAQAVREETTGEESSLASVRAANWAGFFLTFYPSLLFYSTQLVRDAILTLLGLAGLYVAIRFLRQPHAAYAALWLAVAAVLFLLRFYAGVALVASVLLFAMRFRRQALFPALILAAAGIVAVQQGFFGLSIVSYWLDPARITAFRTTTYSIGGSAAGIALDFSNPVAFVLSYGYSFATAMFGPFPWQLSSLVQVIAFPEAVALWLLFPVWLGGVVHLVRSRWRDETLLLLFSLVLIGAVALFSDNIGANTRLRLLPWSAFLIYAAAKMPRVIWW